MKVKLINAANSSNSDTSTQAIAKELRGLKNNLLTLANTSIGGEYLFSGTATSQIPIGADGTYQGNDKNLNAFLGSGVKQKYNITGTQLFLGDEGKVNRTVTTNVPQLSLSEQFPDIMKDSSLTRNLGAPTYISASSTIRDLMGDTDIDTTNDATRLSHFYIQGTKTDGTTFKQQISLNTTDTVDNLLQNIASQYGTNQVNVSINTHGQIEIQDKQTGSSKLDFHMVGAVDFDSAGTDAADVSSNIDLLQAGTTNFEDVIASPIINSLYVKEFTKSGLDSSNAANTIDGIDYDRTNFTQNGAQLTSNISQIDKNTNAYVSSASKLIDVAGVSNLDGKQLLLTGSNITGAAFTAQINLATAGSTFSLDNGVTNYNIFTATAPRAAVDANQMTYQQLLDVVNMAMSGTLPASNTSAGYDTAITTANTLSSTTLDNAGKIVFEDKSAPVTQATMSLYDASSSNYSGVTGSALTFNANSALTVRDPKTDFFAQIEEVIQSVEQGKIRSDGLDSRDPRNVGIQNSIQIMDDLSDHVSRLQTESGSYSQVLLASSDRSDLLIINTKMLQSDIIDTDIAEATLQLQQLSLSYQAMLSTISKVSKLSLVNYL